MLSDRCPVCLSCTVCNVGVLWPNGWMDQDETWHAGRPRPWPHCVGWGPSSASPKAAQPHSPISANICCGHMAGWIKMLHGMEVCLGPGDFVSDGDPAPPFPPKKGTAIHLIFGPCLLWPRSPISATAELLFNAKRHYSYLPSFRPSPTLTGTCLIGTYVNDLSRVAT